MDGDPHSVEIRDKVFKTLLTGVIEEDIDETNDCGDRSTELLPQKGGNHVLEPCATHEWLPPRPSSASTFSSSRGNSIGLVS